MRWIIRISAALAVLVVLSLGALVAVPTERVAALVSERISAATGRAVTIAGEVRPTLWPSLGIRAGGVRVGNPDWVEAGPMLNAERLDVSIEWAALLGGEIRLDRAEFIAPELTLVRAADGRVSWATAAVAAVPDAAIPDAAAPTSAATPLAIGFDRADIVDGRVRWIDETTGRDLTVTGLDAVLSLPSGAGEARVDATADIDGAAFEVAVRLDGVAPFLRGEVRAVALSLGWPGGTAEFDGRAALAPALDGAFTLEATDLAPLLALAGGTMPDLPRGAGRDAIDASGLVTLTDAGSLHLREGDLRLDGNAFALALDMLQGAERPLLRGTVSAPAVSLAMVETGGPGDAGPGTGGAAQASGWSRAPIDVSALFAADAEIALRLGSLDLGAAETGAVELNLALDRGRAVFDIGRVELYGGRLAGQFVVNGRGGLSMGGDMILAGVQLNPLLSEFAGYDRLEGTGNASLRFLAVGNDMAALMSGLEGDGDFAFGAGAILGFDLAGMIRNFDASFQGEGARTVYDSVTGNFTIAGGIVENDDLELSAPWGGVTGAGQVNLGAQTVDYRVIPGVMPDETGQAGIEVPILVSGPWSNLSVRPDLEFLAEQEFLEQRDRIAAEAEARLAAEQDRIEGQVRDRANELLGTDIEAGDGRAEIEDALQNRLAEEAENVLSRILGGGGETQNGSDQ